MSSCGDRRRARRSTSASYFVDAPHRPCPRGLRGGPVERLGVDLRAMRCALDVGGPTEGFFAENGRLHFRLTGDRSCLSSRPPVECQSLSGPSLTGPHPPADGPSSVPILRGEGLGYGDYCSKLVHFAACNSPDGLSLHRFRVRRWSSPGQAASLISALVLAINSSCHVLGVAAGLVHDVLRTPDRRAIWPTRSRSEPAGTFASGSRAFSAFGESLLRSSSRRACAALPPSSVPRPSCAE